MQEPIICQYALVEQIPISRLFSLMQASAWSKWQVSAENRDTAATRNTGD